MKKILLPIITFIAVFNSANAQTDYCKDITKWNGKSTVYFESPTPGDKDQEVGRFGFVKAIDANSTTIFFKLGVSFEDPEKTGNDASITFEDDDVIKFSDLRITKGEKNSINRYVYSALMPLSADDMAKFKTKKVKSYTFMGAKRVPGFGNPKVKLMAYANCLESLTDTPPAKAPDKKSIDGFWGIPFGSSADVVKTTITGKGGRFDATNSKADDLYFFDATFTGRQTSIIGISLIGNKFYQAAVSFPETEDVHLISMFNTIVSELSDVYGNPDITKNFQEPYKEGDGYEVQAIKLGKASYHAKWETNNGNTIFVQINKRGNITLFYTDNTLAKTKEAKKTADY